MDKYKRKASALSCSAIVVSELSRSFKAASYCHCYCANANANANANADRKRNRDGSSSGNSSNTIINDNEALFEVKECNNHGIGVGVGMFARKNIRCGTLIIAHEEPIVNNVSFSSTNAATNMTEEENNAEKDKILNSMTPLFCHECKTPLKTLQDHLLRAHPKDIMHLPWLQLLEGTSGPELVFTNPDSILHCQDCQQVAWCSPHCANINDSFQIHQQLQCNKHSCCSVSAQQLHQFYQSVENPTIFQLAAQAIFRIVIILEVLIAGLIDKKKQPSQDTDLFALLESLLFWNDYGSHPLWWEVGMSEHKHIRQETTQRFAHLMQEFLLLLLQTNHQNIPKPSVISKLCSTDNIGHLLGMLQCNVMEFEYPSPLQQFLEHLEYLKEQLQEQDEEESTDNNNDDDDDDDVQEHLNSLSNSNNNSSNSNNNICHAHPIVGSGLYPLLTLANHSCDPNASIEFLQESNRGSMVAIRDIPMGQEICITYVPNGDLDPGKGGNNDSNDAAARFDAFQPTRTWKWSNRNNHNNDNHKYAIKEENDDVTLEKEEDEEEHGTENEDAHHENNHNNGSTGAYDHDSSSNSLDESSAVDTEELPEGTFQKERAKALLEYGFECRCQRCVLEEEEGNILKVEG